MQEAIRLYVAEPSEENRLRIRERYEAVPDHHRVALSVSDRSVAVEIAAAERPYDALRLGETAARRADWHVQRVAIMAALLRAKFTQHADLATVLTATRDARIDYQQLAAKFWSSQGRNWLGRLLEVVRSEIAAAELLRLLSDSTPSAK